MSNQQLATRITVEKVWPNRPWARVNYHLVDNTGTFITSFDEVALAELVVTAVNSYEEEEEAYTDPEGIVPGAVVERADTNPWDDPDPDQWLYLPNPTTNLYWFRLRTECWVSRWNMPERIRLVSSPKFPLEEKSNDNHS